MNAESAPSLFVTAPPLTLEHIQWCLQDFFYPKCDKCGTNKVHRTFLIQIGKGYYPKTRRICPNCAKIKRTWNDIVDENNAMENVE